MFMSYGTTATRKPARDLAPGETTSHRAVILVEEAELVNVEDDTGRWATSEYWQRTGLLLLGGHPTYLIGKYTDSGEAHRRS